MSGNNGYDSDNISVSLQAMPRTALQALYHAVTGKTERLSRDLKGNVVITYSDFEQLYRRLVQQIEHYDLLAAPTVTIVVKHIDSESLQYSSWERFKEFQVNNNVLTSELSLKVEFITRIPKTPSPQRFVINIGLDSGLPVIHERGERGLQSPYVGFFMFLARDFPTVDISIDFVDFLIAKIFVNLVEEWFKQLGSRLIRSTRQSLRRGTRMPRSSRRVCRIASLSVDSP